MFSALFETITNCISEGLPKCWLDYRFSCANLCNYSDTVRHFDCSKISIHKFDILNSERGIEISSSSPIGDHLPQKFGYSIWIQLQGLTLSSRLVLVNIHDNIPGFIFFVYNYDFYFDKGYYRKNIWILSGMN